MPKRGSWTTRFGFYLAAMGSACGLGNLWRFPYVVGENGGGAFVLLYVLFALMIGLPLLIGELMLGKSTGKSVLTATAEIGAFDGKKFVWIGRMCLILSLVVLSYYAVISGWVLHFSTQFFVGLINPDILTEKGRLEHLMSNGWLQMGLASAHLLVAVVVVLKGVQEGLEKWIGAVMPIFAILLVLLIFKSLSLDSAPEALRFLFYPDFSKLQGGSMLHAIGHVCFTLSVGFGSMVTFGSYLNDSDHIPTAGFRVTILDTILSLFAGLLLFPIVLQASDIPLTDPRLLFEALPKFLLQMPGGVLFGFAFFVCLYLAALGASIGLLEVVVSNIVDRLKIKRFTATWISGAAALFLAVFPAMSSTTFGNVQIGGRPLLENLDSFLINFFLPLIALGMAWVIGSGLKKPQKEKLFVNSQNIESVALFPYWTWFVRWLVPFLIILAFVLQASVSFAQSTSKPSFEVQREISFLWNRIKNSSINQLLLEDGKIRKGDEFGDEAKSFEVVESAHRIFELDPSLNNFSVDEKNRIISFKDIYDKSTAEFYSGRNKLAKEITIFTPWDRPSIDKIIRAEMFLEGWPGGISFSSITAETSLSPLRVLGGPGARRLNFWPSSGQVGLPMSLDFIRISYMVNSAGIPLAIEVIGRDMLKYNESSPVNDGWEPFVYEKYWGRWFPIQNIGKIPVKDFCVRCHTTADSRFSPFPKNVLTKEVFKQVGYKNDGLINGFFKFKELEK